MISFESARQLISEHLATTERAIANFGSALPGHTDRPALHLVVSSTTEFDFGWVFAYTTKEYLETGDITFGLVGNAPLIVDRTDGRIYIAGPPGPFDEYIAHYRSGIRFPA